MVQGNRKQISLYEDAKAGLGSLAQQAIAVFSGFLIMLLVAGGTPSSFVIALSVVLGIAFVAWNEQNRIKKRVLPTFHSEVPLTNQQALILSRTQDSPSEVYVTVGEHRIKIMIEGQGMSSEEIQSILESAILVSNERKSLEEYPGQMLQKPVKPPPEVHPLHSQSVESRLDYSDEVAQATEVFSLETYPEAISRYRTSRYYIQVVVIGHRTVLATNLTPEQSVHITAISSCWVIGRNETCAIPIYERSVSRCHAVIGRHAEEGFYISDLGSSHGTWVNGDRLPTSTRYPLCHGDSVRLGRIELEFFIALPIQSDDSIMPMWSDDSAFEDTCS